MSLRILCLVYWVLPATVSVAQIPHSSHVWVLTEENHSLEEVVGSSKMPYYNQLIHQYGLATQFYSNQHSSLPALMWFVAGAPVTRDNNTVSCNYDNDNIIRAVLKQGYTWRSYQQDLPSAGYQGLYGGRNKVYYRRHNPLIDFTDACPGTGQEGNSVPYSQVQKDFAHGDMVNYAYITPDVDEDAHSGTLEAADRWLQNNLPAILARPEFGPGGDGILFIVWDEGTLSTDNRCSATVEHGCGGRTPTLVIGPQVKHGYKSTTTYHNQSVLKTVCVAMGLSPCPGAAQDAAPMAEFFKSDNGPDSPSDGIVVSTPGNGAIVAGAVHLIANASESQSVSQTEVWDNGTKLGVYGAEIDATYNMAPGKHITTVIDLDSASRAIHQSTVTYSVQAVIDGMQVVSPTPGETINTATVHVVAHATEAVPVGLIEVWDNDVELGRYPGTDVNQYFSLAPGSHTIMVRDLDENFDFLHQSSVSYSVQ
jgi:phosphatidylinositol-3-phosphatase